MCAHTLAMLRAVAGTASGPPPLPDQPDVYTVGEIATKLRYYKRNGEVNRTPVYNLIRTGGLYCFNQDEAMAHWRISASEFHRYLAEGPRQ
jgi:hypothetical protein